MTTDIDRMLRPDEALSIVLQHVHPLDPELVDLAGAGDRYLSAPLVADVSLPPFHAATMDGFAVVHDDPTPARTILGSGFAGDPPTEIVRHGAVARIMTGAPVPDGADAVVPIENTRVEGEQVTMLQADVRVGENIRPIGADMRAGETLLPAGTQLGPAEIGILASLGHERIRVGRQPRVAIFSTGNELVAPGETPGPGQIRDSNRFSLALAVSRAGGLITTSRHVPDNLEQLRDAFGEALEAADVVISSGGVSMGDRDFVKALIGDLAEVHFRRLFMKPGKPLTFATAGETLFFGLPGNPVSCLVCFDLFVRPALLELQGAPRHAYPQVSVTLHHAIRPGDRIEYQRAIVVASSDGTFSASNTGSQMSARLMSFAGANAYLIVPPRESEYRAGEQLQALLFGPPVRDITHGNESVILNRAAGARRDRR